MANYSYVILVLFFLIPIASASDTHSAHNKNPFQGMKFIVVDEDAGEATEQDPYADLGTEADDPYLALGRLAVEEPAAEESANKPSTIEVSPSKHDPFSNAVVVEEKVIDRLSNNLETYELLKTTPVSVLEMGLIHLRRDFEPHLDSIFDDIRLPGEVAVFDIKTENRITEIGYTPVITIDVGLVDPRGGVRGQASSSIACDMLIKPVRSILDTYFGGLFPRSLIKTPFIDHHVNEKAHPRYKELSLNDIADLIYLNGYVSYGHPLEKTSFRCGRLYKK